MKLRQNEEKEIDLRTIVDGELNNQINSMLPLDGTRKMTGVLETVGLDGVQIKSGNSNIIYQPANDGFLLACNCYKHSDGSFRYSSNGKACFYNFQKDSLYPPQIYSTTEGVKDAVITYEVANILTDQTGVKKSGGTMTGALTVAPVGYGSSRFEKYGTNTRIVNVHEDLTNYESLHVMKTISDNNLHSALILEANKKSYNIYGEHNPPFVRTDYMGDGQTNRVITLPFTPRGVLVSNGKDFYTADGTTYGIIATGNTNVTSCGYMVYAFR